MKRAIIIYLSLMIIESNLYSQSKVNQPINNLAYKIDTSLFELKKTIKQNNTVFKFWLGKHKDEDSSLLVCKPNGD